MGTPFKLKSGNASAFKNLGSSPAKQKLPDSFNTMGGPTKTPGYSTTKAATNTNRPAWDRSGGIKVGDHHKVTKGPDAMKAPKNAIVTKTTPTGTKTNIGPSDKYGNKSARGKAKFIEQSGGKTNVNHPYKDAATRGAKKPKSKVSKVVNLVKSKGKEILTHPTTKKVLKVGKKVLKAASKINPALGIMPAPFINPTGQSYNKNQEG